MAGIASRMNKSTVIDIIGKGRVNRCLAAKLNSPLPDGADWVTKALHLKPGKEAPSCRLALNLHAVHGNVLLGNIVKADEESHWFRDGHVPESLEKRGVPERAPFSNLLDQGIAVAREEDGLQSPTWRMF